MTRRPCKRTPLRAGERKVTVRMPKPYTPSAPTGTGTDDYRCFLLDPKVPSDQFITGFNVKPGNPDVVHHVILFRVPADLVAQAEKKDAGTPGQGWTCFGASGLGRGTGGIDDAPWVGAWAPGGSEQVYGKGFGEELGKGSRVVMQVHYNLLAGKKPDRSGAELRLAPVSDDIKPLETRLLPAPVEMPCRPRVQRRRALHSSRSPRGRQEALRSRARDPPPTCCTSCAVRSSPVPSSRAPRRSPGRRRSAASPGTCTCWAAPSSSR